MTLLITAFTLGLILSLLALGVYITFRIFGMPDITVDGSLTLGAAIAAVMVVQGVHPLWATLIAMVLGGVAGMVTGVLHTVFKINSLLSGILVMTGLYSVNLHIMGKSNIPLLTETTAVTLVSNSAAKIAGETKVLNLGGWNVPVQDIAFFLFVLVLIAAIATVLYLFLRTNFGTAMRATGDNQQMIRALGLNTGVMIVIGFALSNALVGLAGALLAQFQGFADVQMGIGMIVLGLASVIIGESLVRTRQIGLAIAGAIIGSILFRLLVAIALRYGLNPNDLKISTAIFVFIALVLPMAFDKAKALQKIDREPVNA